MRYSKHALNKILERYPDYFVSQEVFDDFEKRLIYQIDFLKRQNPSIDELRFRYMGYNFIKKSVIKFDVVYSSFNDTLITVLPNKQVRKRLRTEKSNGKY